MSLNYLSCALKVLFLLKHIQTLLHITMCIFNLDEEPFVGRFFFPQLRRLSKAQRHISRSIFSNKLIPFLLRKKNCIQNRAYWMHLPCFSSFDSKRMKEHAHYVLFLNGTLSGILY